MLGYSDELLERLQQYRRSAFPDSLFETKWPHVFRKEHASLNVLTKPGSSDGEKEQVLKGISVPKRQKWFRSMKSSQALAQSVFANLRVYNKLFCLAGLRGDDGKPLFVRGTPNDQQCELEFDIDYLGEPQSTSVDVFFDGNYRVAVECKLSESEVGRCSRPKLDKDNPEHCNGSFTFQAGRTKRCSLTERGVEYWTYVPRLFNWPADVNHVPCPLAETYQLVRNVLAACVRRGGELGPGHAVLLYDERNPAFHETGKGFRAWTKARESLADPSRLQRCTWQQLTRCLRESGMELAWLADGLHKKYGF
jgi:hypothetical protein